MSGDSPFKSANEAGLRYVNDDIQGIRRKRRGEHFVYFRPNGHAILDRNELVRIERLRIPPAWTSVWICPMPNGHLQATGRDARGRKQYRYHPRWREVRDSTKYDRIVAFGKALPRIRSRVQRDLKLRGLPRAKVVATVVRLLERTLIRVGNDEYARENRSYGLTTMRDRHAKVTGTQTTFEFYGKSHRHRVVTLDDPVLAKIVKRCRDLPGYELFQYVDSDKRPQKIHSEDVNDYIREITGEEFTAKDFRTWSGTVLAYHALRQLPEAGSKRRAKRNAVRAVEAVACLLGNTPAVCKKCYIHPAIFDAYLNGSWSRTNQPAAAKARAIAKLRAVEAALLSFLRRAGSNPPSRR